MRYISIGANILVVLAITLLSTMVLTDAAGDLGHRYNTLDTSSLSIDIANSYVNLTRGGYKHSNAYVRGRKCIRCEDDEHY